MPPQAENSPSHQAMNDEGPPSTSESTLHQQNGNKKRRLTTTAYTRRKRAFAACQFCRLRKTKCDTARPVCGFCQYHNATCIYDDDEEGRERAEQPPLPTGERQESDLIATSLGTQILSSLGELKQLLRQQQQSQSAAKGGGHGPKSVAQNTDTHSHLGSGSSSWASPCLTQPGGPRQNGTGTRTALPAARCESMLRWPIFRGIIKESDAQIESFLFEADVNNQSGAATSNRAFEPIRDDAFVPLCRRFLEHVHPRNPILQKEDLMSFALEVTANGLGWDAASCLVARSPEPKF